MLRHKKGIPSNEKKGEFLGILIPCIKIQRKLEHPRICIGNSLLKASKQLFYTMLNLGPSKYLFIVSFPTAITLTFKTYSVIISNKIVPTKMMCKLSCCFVFDDNLIYDFFPLFFSGFTGS